MKKIEAIVKGVTEDVKAQFKVKRINKAIESAKLNAEEDLETAKQELEEFPEKAKDLNAEQIVEQLFNIFGKIEDSEAVLARLTKVQKYLDEE